VAYLHRVGKEIRYARCSTKKLIASNRGFGIGDLIHFTRFGQHYLILNSIEAADAILQKNARFTSDRPTSSPLDQIYYTLDTEYFIDDNFSPRSGWGRLLGIPVDLAHHRLILIYKMLPVMSRYTEEWRTDRKMFHQNFRSEVGAQFHPSQIQGVRKFISELTTSKMPLMDQIAT